MGRLNWPLQQSMAFMMLLENADVHVCPWTPRKRAIDVDEKVVSWLPWLCNGSRLQKTCSSQWIDRQKVQLCPAGIPQEME